MADILIDNENPPAYCCHRIQKDHRKARNTADFYFPENSEKGVRRVRAGCTGQRPSSDTAAEKRIFRGLAGKRRSRRPET